MTDQQYNKAGVSINSGSPCEFGGLATVTLEHDGAQAVVSTHGAQVLGYQPRAQPPALWLSPDAVFDTDHAIRGGIPICWPWFGDHPSEPGLGAHGFVRTAAWSLQATQSDSSHKMAEFTLEDSAHSRALWPHAFALSYRVSLSEVLRVSLTVRNTDSSPLCFSGALHSYFAVADIEQVELEGLGGCEYLDKVRDFARDTQHESRLRFVAETDRIYLDTDARCVVHDRAGERQIRIDKAGSRTTVVWNPWRQRAAAFGDFPNDGWRSMLCVETSNAVDDAVELAPGAQHTLSAVIESTSETPAG